MNAIELIQNNYGIRKEIKQKNGLSFLLVDTNHIVDILSLLQRTATFSHLSFLTATDELEQNVFVLTYMLHSYEKNMDLGVQIEISREQPVVNSIHHLWEQAGTYQRELKEMFGIDFPGSPRVDEAFILESWNDMPPMRRNFDTREYSENRYFPRPGRESKDVREYMKEKLYKDS